MDTKRIKLILNRYPKLLQLMQYINDAVRNRHKLMCSKSYGALNEGKKFFVIRPNSEDGVQGLMSLFIQTVRWIEYAKIKGYIPFVDFKNYKTQYYDGVNNVWEYYFTQPASVELEEIYSSKNVTISGSSLKKTVNYNSLKKEIFFDKSIARYYHDLIFSNFNYSAEVKQIVEEESQNLNIDRCIGLYLRGTDYVALKPAGEYVQPDIESVIEIIDIFLDRYHSESIFLVTEDGSYYTILHAKYGNKIKLVSFDSFITSYEGNGYLSKSGVLNDDKKKRGMDYLVKLILLSRCKYLISSITMGSIATYALNGGEYEDQYIFDLGLYK